MRSYSFICILFVFIIIYGVLIMIFSCEKDFNPIANQSTDNYPSTENYCNPSPPDSLPGKVGEWELAGLMSDNINVVQVIAIHPEKPYVLFAGTMYDFSAGTDAQLFRSVDYGTSWDTLGYAFGYGAHFNDVAFDPSNPNIIYVVNGNVLFKSSNCGEIWQDITGDIYVDSETDIWDLAIDPENTDIIYAGTGGFHGGHLYKSVDGGNHWVKKTSDVIDGAD
jgi:hypothetical protein